jgi:hypothetical protein
MIVVKEEVPDLLGTVAGDQKVVSSLVEITAGTSSSGRELMTKTPCIG